MGQRVARPGTARSDRVVHVVHLVHVVQVDHAHHWPPKGLLARRPVRPLATVKVGRRPMLPRVLAWDDTREIRVTSPVGAVAQLVRAADS